MAIARVCIVILAAAVLGGCMMPDKATMFADTQTSDGDGFSEKSPQWAYEGEEVTIDFAPDMRGADYIVFTWPGNKVDLLARHEALGGCFRGVGVFKAGRESRRNVVHATSYMIRGQPDWFYDKDTKTWLFHPPGDDEHDMNFGEAEIVIVCYRVTIDMTFTPGRRTIASAVLRIIKGDGTKTEIRDGAKTGGKGFELLGPNAKGAYHVRYTPTHKEVNRTGKTDVELLLTYTDGTQEKLPTTIDTP